ncbi:hypothetical protein DBV15_00045 [Temnothorax longispinosus]|uniref:Uncharacterized protein n=1 Tax=Temnothorax longispinosus TaxID=300112 RepID=A0A4S2KDT4_9HYME|nr:hypothetical protein DBV15_00045 [Temnothorax longispinosus]
MKLLSQLCRNGLQVNGAQGERNGETNKERGRGKGIMQLPVQVAPQAIGALVIPAVSSESCRGGASFPLVESGRDRWRISVHRSSELPRVASKARACDTDGRVAVSSTVLLVGAVSGFAGARVKLRSDFGDRIAGADDAPFHPRDHVRAVEKQ